MNTNFLNIVRRIAADYGEAILGDPPRLKALFSDLAQDVPKPLRLAFGRCIEAGAYNALKSAADSAERAERKAQIAQRVRDEHGLDMALCAEALDVLEAACGETIKKINNTVFVGESAQPSAELPLSIIPNNKLRACARQQLRGVWRKTAFAVFIYCLICFVPSWTISLSRLGLIYPVFSIIYCVLSIITMIISGPFSLGFAGYYLKRIRGEQISTKNIFDGFNQFSRSFVLYLLIFIFSFSWIYLLLVIPALLIFIVRYNLGWLFIIFSIPIIIKYISYSMSYFILYDNPDMKPRQALKESARMMYGYKGKLVELILSFIGWILLGILTLGIGYLWLSPYIGMAIANFYENLKTNKTSA